MHNSIDSMQAPTLTEEDAARLEARLLEVAELETMMSQRPLIDDNGAYDTGRKLPMYWSCWDPDGSFSEGDRWTATMSRPAPTGRAAK